MRRARASSPACLQHPRNFANAPAVSARVSRGSSLPRAPASGPHDEAQPKLMSHACLACQRALPVR
eukprot:9642973-Alexandrium_andersonii.AAC.1